MSKRSFGKFRSLVLATLSAVTVLLGAVTAVLAGSGGHSFP